MVALLARAPDLAVGELHDARDERRVLKLLGVVLLVEAAHDGLRQLARLEAVHDLALGGRRAALAVDGGELVRVARKVACRRCWRGCPVQRGLIG